MWLGCGGIKKRPEFMGLITITVQILICKDLELQIGC